MIRTEKASDPSYVPCVVPAEPARGAPFDYSGLEAKAAAKLREAAGIVRSSLRAQSREVVAAGRVLNEAKASLEHGQFTAWVKAELGWTMTTAQNYMRAAEVFADKSELISLLPPTALFKLSNTSTPEPVRQEIFREAESGRAPTIDVIAERVAEAKAELRKERKEAKLTPAQRKSRRETARRHERERQKHIAERMAEDARRQEALAMAARIIVDAVAEPSSLVDILTKAGEVGIASAMRKALGS